MARYVTHIAIPSKIIRMLECAAGNTDLAGCVPASFSRTIYYINGTYVHAEIFVRANKLGIETAIVI